MKYAYCDCFSGISGDMFLGALVDAGLPIDTLREQLALLNLPEPVQVVAEETRKGALRACLVDVIVGESHHHRHFTDIAAMIEESSLSDTVKRTSLAIFRTLAEAEARVHGTSIEHVHFHEVGALDSIVPCWVCNTGNFDQSPCAHDAITGAGGAGHPNWRSHSRHAGNLRAA